jgi:hypothetical protein
LKTIQNSDDMFKWLSKAKRGDKAVYYNGMLIADRERHFLNGGLADTMPDPMRSAKMAWTAYMNGDVYLVQKRNGAMNYDYIAVKS